MPEVQCNCDYDGSSEGWRKVSRNCCPEHDPCESCMEYGASRTLHGWLCDRCHREHEEHAREQAHQAGQVAAAGEGAVVPEVHMRGHEHIHTCPTCAQEWACEELACEHGAGSPFAPMERVCGLCADEWETVPGPYGLHRKWDHLGFAECGHHTWIARGIHNFHFRLDRETCPVEGCGAPYAVFGRFRREPQAQGKPEAVAPPESPYSTI